MTKKNVRNPGATPPGVAMTGVVVEFEIVVSRFLTDLRLYDEATQTVKSKFKPQGDMA